VHQRLTDLIRWIGFSRILASAFGVIVMVVGVWWVVRVPPPPPEATIPFASSTIAVGLVAPGLGNVASPASAVARITIYVSGEVVKPGVYVLLPTARIIDALQAAGGATSAADLVVVNLAAPLVDAAQVFIPRIGSTPRVKLPRPRAGINLPTAGSVVVGSSGGGTGSGSVVPGIVDLNSASLSDLDSLPGVGPSTAQAIIDYRVANGPYASVDDLLNVRGIGPSKLAAMRVRVRV
jgi:competence protein ComEA